MWIKSLKLENVRSFPSGSLEFSKTLNILIGPNNAGKSTILLPLLGLQDGLPTMQSSDVRLGETTARVNIDISDLDRQFISHQGQIVTSVAYEYPVQNNNFLLVARSPVPSHPVKRLSNREPFNFIYPFISKRKVVTLGESVTDQTVEQVPSTFENLNAKIDRLSNPELLPAHLFYMRACDQILGFRVTTAHTAQGKRAVYTVYNLQKIPLLAMGEGVMNILVLVVHLALADNHLFLIEEPENDVHPKALKALMDLVQEKSATNQFIITTHSNIVLKKLGGLPGAKIFQVDLTFVDRMPVSTVREVGGTFDERRRVLEDLGYEFSDMNMWEAWLLLEESSAEKIIREYLIPWFTPSLQGRLRTYSAHSLSEVAPRFQDFNELFVFLHLEPTYKNRAWVIVDGGDEELEIINKLKSIYKKSGWHEEHFRQFSQHEFECYFPAIFHEDITAIGQCEKREERREMKKALLNRVENWIQEDKEKAKNAFADSASEVITILKEIGKSLA